jgi:predicted aspartyl protease
MGKRVDFGWQAYILRFMRRAFVLMGLVLVAAGCATDPYSKLETATPTLSPAQIAELQKTAKTPEELGIQMQVTERSVGFLGVNVVEAPENVIVPLVEVPTDKPDEPGGLYRAPVIHATVNGKADVRLLLDSGSNRNLFGYTLAHDLGIPTIAGLKSMTGYGIGGAVDDYGAIVPTMQIGSISFQKTVAIIGPDAQVLGVTRGTQVMLLGVNALHNLSYLTIDYVHGNVIFGARDSYLPDDTLPFLTTTPLHWLGELPAVDISIDGRDPVPCILDTGGDYGMLVPRLRAIELGYWKPGKKDPLSLNGGVAGASLATSYVIKQVRLGGATFTRIPARTALIGPEAAGGQVFLGNSILRRYRVTFDFKHSTLWLER